MRSIVLALVVGTILVGTGMAQTPAPKSTGPKPAVPELPPLPLSPPKPIEPPPLPPEGFGVDLPPGTVVSPTVRPPMPVAGPPIEVPEGPHFWADVDFLYWRSKGGLLPSLVATELGSPSQAVPTSPLNAFLISDNRINGTMQSGMQASVGYWLDKPFGTGVEARYTGFLHNDNLAQYTGTDRTFLNRPFWNEAANSPALFLLSSPSGSSVGLVRVGTSFDSFGIEANYLRRGPAMFSESFHWIMGLRYWNLEEELFVEGGSKTAGVNVSTFDSFATRNQFFGGQIGGKWNWTRNRFMIDLSWKMAVGAMLEDVNVDGRSMAVLPTGVRVDAPGGFLALSSNMGDHSRTKLAWIRESQIALSYAVHDNVILRVGYSFMYVSGVVRPGEQVDLGINPTLLPFSATPPTAPARPGFRFNDEIFFMYGVNLGLTIQF